MLSSPSEGGKIKDDDEHDNEPFPDGHILTHPRIRITRLDKRPVVLKIRAVRSRVIGMINTKLWLAQRQLGNKFPQKRLEAVQKLRAMEGDGVVAALVQALEDVEPAVRTEAAHALGEFKHADSTRGLITALRDHYEPVQEAAVQSLRKLEAATAIEPLVGVLQRGGPGAQWHAAQALKSLGWIPRSSGEQIPYYVATGDFHKLATFGSAAVSALGAVLRGGSPERRVAVANVLGELNDASAFKPLLNALKDAEPRVRTAAASGLGRLGNRQAAPELVGLLKDRDRYVRAAAASALGSIGDANAVESLLALVGDRDWDVRQTVASALGKLGDRRTMPGLLGLLNDKDTEVREAAAEALGRVGDESALGHLALAMMDEEVGVRQAAARSLTILDAFWERAPSVRELVPEIQQAMRHQSPSVQFAASGLMRRITGKTSADIHAESHKVAETPTGPHVPILIKLLRDSDEAVRLAAAESLGRVKSQDVLRALQIAMKDSSEWVRVAAQKGVAVQSQE